MAFPLSGGNSLRERLLGSMSEGGADFKAPFGLELPNRLDDVPSLVEYIRGLVQSGELDLSGGFEGEGPEVSLPGTRPMGRPDRPVRRAEGGRRGRAGMQHRRARKARGTAPRRRQRLRRSRPVRQASQPSRSPVRRSTPVRASRPSRPSNYRIKAPRGNRVLIRNRGRKRGRNRIPMGLARAEGANVGMRSSRMSAGRRRILARPRYSV